MSTRLHSPSLVILGVTLLASPSAADQAIVSLPQLIAQSTHIVIGTCREGQRSSGSSVVLFTVDVEQQLHGTMPNTFMLQTNAAEPEGPNCGVGVRKLLFLRHRTQGTVEREAAPRRAAFDPVDGGAGVIEIAHDGAIAATAAIVQRALDPRSASRLTAFQDLLRRSATPPPRPLVAALLDGQRGVAVADRALLAEMACDTEASYLPAAQLWAISQIGTLRVDRGRDCLEALVARGADRARRLAAVEALGDLGDGRSVPVILPFVEAAAGGPSTTKSPARDADLMMVSILALGKIRAAEAIPALARLAREQPDLALHSTVVHALGLIGGAESHRELTQIGTSHPHPLVRDQALRTATSLGLQPDRRLR